jgi:hypothetical protein
MFISLRTLINDSIIKNKRTLIIYLSIKQLKKLNKASLHPNILKTNV